MIRRVVADAVHGNEPKGLFLSLPGQIQGGRVLVSFRNTGLRLGFFTL